MTKKVSELKCKSEPINSPLVCPECGEDKVLVVDTRSAFNRSVLRRRRACWSCDYRWTTWETDQDPNAPADHLEGLTWQERQFVCQIVDALKTKRAFASLLTDLQSTNPEYKATLRKATNGSAT